MVPQNPTTSRSPEETALLRTVLRRFPGSVLGGYYAPDDLQFVVKEARGAHLYDFSGREYLDYVSLAHSEEDIQRTVQVFTAAFEAVAEQRP